MSLVTEGMPPGLAALHAFAKTHTPAPLLSFIGRFKPAAVSDELAAQLRALHRVRSNHAAAAQQIAQIDDKIGTRLAADKLHATEVIELKLQPPNEKAAAAFDLEAKALATLVTHARDADNASALGLAFAIWLRAEANRGGRDLQCVRQEAFSQIHLVFKLLNEQKLLADRRVLAFCQSLLNAIPPKFERQKTSMLIECLQIPGFVALLMQASGDIDEVQILRGFAGFLISQEASYNDFSSISFLKRLQAWSEREEIVRQLANLHLRSVEPVDKLAPSFAAFRFPAGLCSETVQAWSNVRSGKELLACIARLARPCQGTRIAYLSPHAQLLSHFADKTLSSFTLGETDQLSRTDYEKRWAVFLSRIAGIELAHEQVRSRFIAIVSNENRLKSLLRQSQRPKLIQKIAGDGSDRESWVLSKLLEAAGSLTPEDYSMCSICLGSSYLYDTEGRFCNRKTFRDFAAFIDRDIQNLRAFIDPKYAAKVEGESVGHVKRLLSYIRDFLIDPQNAHYTNFEVHRTKPFSQK